MSSAAATATTPAAKQNKPCAANTDLFHARRPKPFLRPNCCYYKIACWALKTKKAWAQGPLIMGSTWVNKPLTSSPNNVSPRALQLVRCRAWVSDGFGACVSSKPADLLLPERKIQCHCPPTRPVSFGSPGPVGFTDMREGFTAPGSGSQIAVSAFG